MVESMNGDRIKSGSSFCRSYQNSYPMDGNSPVRNRVSHINIRQARQSEHNHHQPHVMTGYLHSGRLQLSVRKSLAFFAHLTTKFPLIIVRILIVIYAVPVSLVILALFILITVVFAIPSILVLYFAFPTMDWLVRELVNWVSYHFCPFYSLKPSAWLHFTLKSTCDSIRRLLLHQKRIILFGWNDLSIPLCSGDIFRMLRLPAKAVLL